MTFIVLAALTWLAVGGLVSYTLSQHADALNAAIERAEDYLPDFTARYGISTRPRVPAEPSFRSAALTVVFWPAPVFVLATTSLAVWRHARRAKLAGDPVFRLWSPAHEWPTMDEEEDALARVERLFDPTEEDGEAEMLAEFLRAFRRAKPDVSWLAGDGVVFPGVARGHIQVEDGTWRRGVEKANAVLRARYIGSGLTEEVAAERARAELAGAEVPTVSVTAVVKRELTVTTSAHTDFEALQVIEFRAEATAHGGTRRGTAFDVFHFWRRDAFDGEGAGQVWMAQHVTSTRVEGVVDDDEHELRAWRAWTAPLLEALNGRRPDDRDALDDDDDDDDERVEGSAGEVAAAVSSDPRDSDRLAKALEVLSAEFGTFLLVGRATDQTMCSGTEELWAVVGDGDPLDHPGLREAVERFFGGDPPDVVASDRKGPSA